jgi:hypothetical protein
MNVYLLDDPATPDVFARFSALGTWSDGQICKRCGTCTSRLVAPLRIEWDPGSDRLGDFSWGGYACVVPEAVKTLLIADGFECEFSRAEVLKPVQRTKKKRISFPYDGPPLFWLTPTKKLHADEPRSRIMFESDCVECGQKRYTFKRSDIFIAREQWGGEKIFRIQQFEPSDATFITELGLECLNRANFTNLCPKLAGHID